MASRILDNICIAHIKNDNIHDVGLGKSSTMEFSAEIDPKTIIL